MNRLNNIALSVLLLASPALALAALPKPTQAQVEAAGLKKAEGDAKAAREKEALLAAMDAISTHWRKRAAAQGWTAHAPVPIAAQVAAVSQPITQSSPSGQPNGQLGAAAANAPITSEKSGTAAPSADVKPRPSVDNKPAPASVVGTPAPRTINR